MIKVTNALKSFDDLRAVDEANLEVVRGHIHGLLGPNGAGKTTLIRSIVGLYDLDQGRILIDGQVLTRDHKTLKKRIGLVTQHVNLDKELTLEENLEFAGRLYGLNKKSLKPRIDELLKAFDLYEARKRQVKKSSGGMKRKLMIAKALIHDPDLIILDEPTVGIDVKARKEIWEMLLKLKNQGKTMLLTTHYIEEAEYLSDMISLIYKGKIFQTDSVKNLVDHLGQWCLDYQVDHKSHKAFYRTKEAVDQALMVLEHPGQVRLTQLEDVYTLLLEKQVTYGN